jgi:chromate reductase
VREPPPYIVSKSTNQEPDMKIIAISGSLRKASFNTQLLELVKAQASGHDVEIVSIGDIPLYNGDVEEAGMPASVTALSEKIRAADAVYFATPEYNFSTSGVLKNAIDWLSRDREPSMPLAGKVVALGGTSAGMSGTSNAQAHLRHTLSLLGCDMVTNPQVLVAANYEAMPEPSDKLKELIGNQLEAMEKRVKMRG